MFEYIYFNVAILFFFFEYFAICAYVYSQFVICNQIKIKNIYIYIFICEIIEPNEKLTYILFYIRDDKCLFCIKTKIELYKQFHCLC